MACPVVVFLDYQNVYMGARDAFHAYGSPPQGGQVDPHRLAELLVSKGPPGVERELREVRVYRGQPDSQKDPRGYAANDRQCSHWRTLPKTTVITRALRYPYDWPSEREQEKGIDVKLAIDLVAGAVRKEYEVAILMSTDTDLKPALEFVRDLQGTRIRAARWRDGHRRPATRAGSASRAVRSGATGSRNRTTSQSLIQRTTRFRRTRCSSVKRL